MKQLIIGGLIAFIISPTVASAVGSSTMTLFPTEITVEQGQAFDLNIQANPNGESLDTARAYITFTPGILRADEATLTGSFDRVAPGNFMNNQSGIVSLGGFHLETPVTESGQFGKIVFTALQEGVAKIKISADTKMISDGEEKIDIALLGETTVQVVSAGAPQKGAGTLIVESSTHTAPEAWYSRDSAKVQWSVEKGETPITRYLFAFDQNASTVPVTYLKAVTSSNTFEKISDGIWYFHIRGQHSSGAYTNTVHRKIQVDTQPPNVFQTEVENDQLFEGENAKLFYATTDETSGVLHYGVSINHSPFEIQSSPLTVKELKQGNYLVEVRAVDQAGNERYSQSAFRVYPKDADLQRPVTLKQVDDDVKEKQMRLLITLALVVLCFIGIIYWTRKRMNKKNK